MYSSFTPIKDSFDKNFAWPYIGYYYKIKLTLTKNNKLFSFNVGSYNLPVLFQC